MSTNNRNNKIYFCFSTIIVINGILNFAIGSPDYFEAGHKRRKREEDYEDYENDMCSKGEFGCENGGKCIDIRKVCNNVNDCTDKSDENPALCEAKTNVTCSVDLSRTTRISCEFKGSSTSVTCNEKINPWTKVKIDCNKGFLPKENEKWIKESICMENGQWSHPIPVCEYDCGKPTTKEVTFQNGSVESYEHYPWNAFLYRRRGDVYYHIPGCHGILITPFSIITSYICTVYDRNLDEKEILEKDIVIGLGKLFQDYNDPKDDGTVQKFEVERIRRIAPVGTESDSVNFDKEFQIAILDLKTQVDYSQYVMPACFDREDKFQLTSTSVGHAVLGSVHANDLPLRNDALKTYSLQYADYNNCEEFIFNHFKTRDVGGFLNNGTFCVYFDKEVKNEIEDETRGPTVLGSGLTFIFSGKHYAYGIIKGHYRNAVLPVVDLKKPPHRKYIDEAIETVNNYRLFQLSEKCPVPYSAGTVYSTLPCEDLRTCPELSTYKIMDANTPIFMNCKANFTFEGNCQFKACSEGSWFPEVEACIRLCEPLPKLVNVTTECRYKGEVVSCYNSVKNGTVATSFCRTQDQNTDSVPYINACEDNGEWRNSPSFMSTICIHKCGILKTQTLIEGGETGKVKEHPWFAALYYVNVTTPTAKDNQTKANISSINYICGGTLITRLSVLSAAHCGVINTPQGRKVKSSSLFRIGLGKFYRDYDNREEEGVQQYFVNHVYIPDEYIGDSLHYYHDIAIFELSKPARITNFVLPACIDMNNLYVIGPDSFGKVVGFGRDSPTGNLTTTLRKATLPVIGRDRCTPRLNSVDSHLTKDKFCAYFEPNESYNVSFSIVRQGDSGSGLTFSKGSRYYVYGIVSIQTYDYISMFTNVTHDYNLNFISNILEIISKKRGSVL